MPGYGISDEPEGMLSWDWAEEQMVKSRNYWICTTRPDGRPHASPVWGVWLDGALYFSCGPDSRKARNLAHSPEIVVHLESGDDAVIAEGSVEEMSADPALRTRIADVYEAKYPGFRPQFEESQKFFVLRPRVVLAWKESEFLTSPTRWRFER
jgi:nitroimidazol reductase NimA-like FMN-containing flavoprotein (pyridoxamine 5'-phosphate oxidase superfamily)